MSAIFTKGVEIGRGAGSKNSPSDSPGGPRRPPLRLSLEAGTGLEGAEGPRTDLTGRYSYVWGMG